MGKYFLDFDMKMLHPDGSIPRLPSSPHTHSLGLLLDPSPTYLRDQSGYRPAPV
jgi:hypothetical protein